MPTARSLWVYMRWEAPRVSPAKSVLVRLFNSVLPIRKIHQTLFAEAFSQALVSGMAIPVAIDCAAEICRSRRFRVALREMASSCRTGDSLTRGLAKTGVWTSKLFRAALSVGESRGHLAEELEAFARHQTSNIAERLARTLGRSPEATRFVLALSRLLRDYRLTISIIQDAGVVASGEGSGFDRVVARLVEEMKDGEPFAVAMERQSPPFDPFLCRLVAATSGREQLRRTLARVCGSPVVDAHSRDVSLAPR